MNETDQTNESPNPSGEQWNETMADVPEFNDKAQIDEHEALHAQEVVANADVDFAEALSKALPQVGEDGKVNYYICGSVAMDLLPRVRKLETFHQKGKDGEPESQGITELPDDARNEFLKGVRKKGHDIDIVRMTRRTSLTIEKQKVIDECKNPASLDTLSAEKHEASFIAFDAVGETQSQYDYYYSKATLDDGEEIYISSPGTLIGAKAYEVANLRNFTPTHTQGIEKRQKDLSTMISGFSKIMSREQIIEAAKTAIMHRLESDAEDYENGEGGMPLEHGIRQIEDMLSECFED